MSNESDSRRGQQTKTDLGVVGTSFAGAPAGPHTSNEQIAAAEDWRDAVNFAALELGVIKDTDQYHVLVALARSCYLTGKLAGIAHINESMNKTYAAARRQYPVATGKEIEP